MTDRIRILYLDDEEQNLFSFQALFRRDYDVFTTSSVQEAIDYLNREKVAIIFSDQKMPEVSGVEFFESIIHEFPDPVRILITGYADMEAVIDAINKGQVYRYVTKPWDVNELKICVENAAEKYKRDVEIKTKNKELEKANSELERFIYSASHDLRAPVASIRGVLQVAKMEVQDSKALEYFDMIEKSTNSLNDFIGNIIHYYQNTRDDEMVKKIDLNKLIEESINKCKGFTQADKVVFKTDVSQSADFVSDDQRIRMVLNNLVNNAIKFRDESKEEQIVNIQVIGNQEKAKFVISDNGLAIADDKLPFIFEMFNHSDNKQSGAGIGLYIVKEALKKLNGNISVTSKIGEGSRFTFEVPNKS